MNTEKSLTEMTREIVATFEEYKKTGTVAWTYEIAAKDLSYQIGSLMKLLMQMKGERFAHNKTPQQIKEGISDELADILAEVLFIAHDLGIDIGQAWAKMVQSDEEKIKARGEKEKGSLGN
jgi:NTP pyrophosphatase (non-canonical NTP hydrolase)